MRHLRFLGIALTSLLIASCSSSTDEPTQPIEPQASVVSARIAMFEGEGQGIEGENNIDNIQACLFENGLMTKVYKNLNSTHGNYQLKLDRYAGNLYMIANTDNRIDLESLQSAAITEAEWKKTIFSSSGNQPEHFFSGMLALDPHNQGTTAQTLTLKRGVARFDIVVDVAGSASVKKVTLTRIAQSAYLFPQGKEAASPDNVERKDITTTFEDGLTQTKKAVLYVYEQTNEGIEVQAEISFDGKEHRILKKAITGSLKRNSIYTITIRKNDIDVNVRPEIGDWEPGSDTELAPYMNTTYNNPRKQ